MSLSGIPLASVDGSIEEILKASNGIFFCLGHTPQFVHLNDVFGNEAIVQLGKTTNFVPTASFSDIPFDVVSIQSRSGILHRDGLADRIALQENGLYQSTYHGTVDAALNSETNFRIRRNDNAVMSGSLVKMTESSIVGLTPGDRNFSCTSYFNASSGDFVTLQGQDSESSPFMNLTWSVRRCRPMFGVL